MKFRQTVRTK